MLECDPTATFKTTKGANFPLAIHMSLMWVILHQINTNMYLESCAVPSVNTCDDNEKYIPLLFLKLNIVLASSEVVKVFWVFS